MPHYTVKFFHLKINSTSVAVMLERIFSSRGLLATVLLGFGFKVWLLNFNRFLYLIDY